MKTSPKPNYDDYSLDKLYKAERSIDREKYPERYNEIRTRIKQISKLANPDYKCRNCGNDECEIGEIHVTGSTIGKLLDLQGTKFKIFICRQCNYTELYKCPKDRWGKILDFLLAG